MRKSKTNKEYWIDRETLRIAQNEQGYNGVRQTVARIYDTNNQYVLGELRKIYSRGVADPTYLRQLETADSLREFLTIVKKKGLYDMLPDNYKFRADRLTSLNRNIWLRCKESMVDEYVLTSNAYSRGVNGIYTSMSKDLSEASGLASSFGTIPIDRLERIMAVRPDGSDFSATIWRNNEKLITELNTTLASGFQLGKSIEQMSSELSRRMDVAKFNTDRIIQTEANYYANQAEYECYKDYGVERYQYIAVLDNRTSETCQHLEGKVYKLSEAKVGVNYPPMHPFCRSSTIPVLAGEVKGYAGERIARYEKGGADKYIYDGEIRQGVNPVFNRDPISPQATLAPNTTLGYTKSFNEDINPAVRRQYKQALSEDFSEYPQVQNSVSGVSGTGRTFGDTTKTLGTYNNANNLNISVVAPTTSKGAEAGLTRDQRLVELKGLDSMRINFQKVKMSAKDYQDHITKNYKSKHWVAKSAKGIAHHEFGHALGHYLEARGKGLTNNQIAGIKRAYGRNGKRITNSTTAENMARVVNGFRNSARLDTVQSQIVKTVLEANTGGEEVFRGRKGVIALSRYGKKNWHESFAELFSYARQNPNTEISRRLNAEIAKRLA